jgi:uncharacterized protein
MGAKRECLVMAKPAGPRCNLACSYCYYLGKEAVLPRADGRLSLDLLERYIEQRIEASGERVAHFEWHGGEPTLVGLEYFREIRRIQRKKLPEGREVSNGLQTNGYLIDGAWASFLAKEGFSVGLSLDGPAELHDAFRKTAGGAATQQRVEKAYRLLRERGVFVNLLCVLNARNAAEPEAVYGYFRGLGAAYLQFLPFVPPLAAPSAAAATSEAIGDFLCRVFDRWIADGVGRIVIQNIDEALRPIYGLPHALCVHRETCGQVLVLERDGGVYACDHFVDAEHLLGNIKDLSLSAIAADPRLADFGEAKRAGLSPACQACEFLAQCNGGCPKDRQTGLNRLCPAYKRFFSHSKAELSRLAAHMRAGRPLLEFQALSSA